MWWFTAYLLYGSGTAQCNWRRRTLYGNGRSADCTKYAYNDNQVSRNVIYDTLTAMVALRRLQLNIFFQSVLSLTIVQCQQIEIVKNSDQWLEIDHRRPMKHRSPYWWCNGDKHMAAKHWTFHHRTVAAQPVSFSTHFYCTVFYTWNVLG